MSNSFKLLSEVFVSTDLEMQLCKWLCSKEADALDASSKEIQSLIHKADLWAHTASVELPGFTFGPAIQKLPIRTRRELLDTLKRATVPHGSAVAITTVKQAKHLSHAIKMAHKTVFEFLISGGAAGKVVVMNIRFSDFEITAEDTDVGYWAIGNANPHRNPRGAPMRYADGTTLAPAHLVSERWGNALDGVFLTPEEAGVRSQKHVVDVHFCDYRHLCLRGTVIWTPAVTTQRAMLCTMTAARLAKACAPKAEEQSALVALAIRDCENQTLAPILVNGLLVADPGGVIKSLHLEAAGSPHRMQ
eukprot:gnl/MRDRNA2_/MRDRNA2_85451_c0_seq1.p1 gnl/MRDRNA2_/MRDRNA2_85451_c0~~gnl/MRDRNA2_/MRDRNA2_85451_c0_seq1.p1  ORF type:complete len:304 (-),score=63.18 gnl/MRDRNA2_/MRDRNA2_85451_c0_seq1:330-1241(-)